MACQHHRGGSIGVAGMASWQCSSSVAACKHQLAYRGIARNGGAKSK